VSNNRVINFKIVVQPRKLASINRMEFFILFETYSIIFVQYYIRYNVITCELKIYSVEVQGCTIKYFEIY